MNDGDAGLGGLKVLVAEDDLLVALDVAEMLKALGCMVMGPASSAAETLELLRRERPDLALLDVKLRDGVADEIAEALGAAGVPFVVTSGYNGTELQHPLLREAPHVGKPYSSADVVAAIRRCIRDRGSWG